MTLVEHLRNKSLSISFAESMTGGALSKYITQFSGASDVFKGSIVCYDTQVKVDVLGISQQLIETHGVVSHNVCEAMVISCKEMFKSDIAVSITGYAEGIHKDIFVGISYKDTQVFHIKRKDQNRTQMIDDIVLWILDKIYVL
ncbi:MAG: CinA family protein [Acholeplasmataceae bacterium]|jgi:PncC family amidohydrolase